MGNDRANRFERWASLAFIAGELRMMVLWIICTTVHGPTSYDETRTGIGWIVLGVELWKTPVFIAIKPAQN